MTKEQRSTSEHVDFVIGVDIHVDRTKTYTTAIMESPNGVLLVGTAKRNPDDPYDAKVGRDVATARVLRELADHLTDTGEGIPDDPTVSLVPTAVADAAEQYAKLKQEIHRAMYSYSGMYPSAFLRNLGSATGRVGVTPPIRQQYDTPFVFQASDKVSQKMADTSLTSILRQAEIDARTQTPDATHDVEDAPVIHTTSFLSQALHNIREAFNANRNANGGV